MDMGVPVDKAVAHVIHSAGAAKDWDSRDYTAMAGLALALIWVYRRRPWFLRRQARAPASVEEQDFISDFQKKAYHRVENVMAKLAAKIEGREETACYMIFTDTDKTTKKTLNKMLRKRIKEKYGSFVKIDRFADRDGDLRVSWAHNVPKV
jgi:hypothetical protein